MKEIGPFDIINAINKGNKDIVNHPGFNSAYNSFLINRQLSYFPDTIMVANILNSKTPIDNDMQFDLLINTIKPRFRKAEKWAKTEILPHVELVKRYFNISDKKAREALSILTQEQIELIENRFKEAINE